MVVEFVSRAIVVLSNGSCGKWVMKLITMGWRAFLRLIFGEGGGRI